MRLQPARVIVAFCTNMPPERAVVFCRSIRQVWDHREAEIVLIADEPQGLHERLAPLGVTYHHTSCDFKPQTRKSEKLLKRIFLHACRLYAATPLDRAATGGAAGRIRYRLAESWCHPLTARWFAYRHVLLERPGARHVLLSDVKDVVLQGDCFAGLDSGKAWLVEQSEPYGQCYWDTLWLREAFGRHAVEAMQGILPVNGGTVLGGYAPVLEFVERATAMFLRHPFRIVDQAAINWMLHQEGDGPRLGRIPNVVQQVAIISGNWARHAVQGRDGVILRTEGGEPIPLVHMWDRWEDLCETVLRRYLPQPAEALAETPPVSLSDLERGEARGLDMPAREPSELGETAPRRR